MTPDRRAVLRDRAIVRDKFRTSINLYYSIPGDSGKELAGMTEVFVDALEFWWREADREARRRR